jgi:predicted transcriptional regulator
MRTTVDIDPAVLERARKLALSERRTLGSVLSDALAAYLGKRRASAKNPPFELLVRGSAHGRFPTAEELIALDDEEDAARLRIRGTTRRATP